MNTRSRPPEAGDGPDHRRLGLRPALILLVLVPLLAVFGLGGFVVLGELEKRLEERLQEDIALIARTLKVPLARALERDRQRSVERALHSTFEFGRVYGVYVYDSEGELVAKADRLAERDDPSIRVADIGREQATGDYRSMGGREVYSYFTPLADAGGQVIGMLQVTRRASEIRDYLDALRGNVFLIVTSFCALFIAIVIVGHHIGIGRPLRRLSATMADVAGGNTAARAATGGPQEIHSLAQRFNSMLDGIAERDAALAAERERQSRLEDRLRQSEKYALAGRLAAGVAHELGTPLSVVDGHAQRLLRGKSPHSADHATLLRIRDAAARMAAIVQQLLGFTRSSSQRPRRVPVARAIKMAAADVRVQFENAATALQLTPGPENALITFDEGRLREAIVHLLKNALQAVPRGLVRISWTSDERGTVIEVDDSGPGIPEENRERIFEPFFTTKPPGEGSGLGLAIVNGIAADYGAEVVASSSPLGGARFSIIFTRGEEE